MNMNLVHILCKGQHLYLKSDILATYPFIFKRLQCNWEQYCGV
jgi:hypothetical protein